MLPSDAMSQPSAGVLPVVLAAGLGTRMKSSRPKVLHELCGRPMLAYVLEWRARSAAGVRSVVYSPATSAITEIFAGEAGLRTPGDASGDGRRAARRPGRDPGDGE